MLSAPGPAEEKRVRVVAAGAIEGLAHQIRVAQLHPQHLRQPAQLTLIDLARAVDIHHGERILELLLDRLRVGGLGPDARWHGDVDDVAPAGEVGRAVNLQRVRAVLVPEPRTTTIKPATEASSGGAGGRDSP